MNYEKEEILYHHNQHKASYTRLAENIKHALITFLTDNHITYHSISFRIKEFESYYEKISRKGYDNPIEQVEDFCGIRIVCFYPLDLENIASIIHNEFDVLNAIDKTSTLQDDRFGYRSNHYIVKIKTDWSKAPNYRGLENFKAEIQVRTILMHAWADIEHRLAYKQKDQVPRQFRRKLNQLSALLEIADEQFQGLKNEKELFKKSLIITNEGKKEFDFSKELNVDTLQAYLDFCFPDKLRTVQDSTRLLNDLKKFNITLLAFDAMYQELSPFWTEIEKDINSENKWAQTGASRIILDLKSDSYWKSREQHFSKTQWGKDIIKWRKLLNEAT